MMTKRETEYPVVTFGGGPKGLDILFHGVAGAGKLLLQQHGLDAN